MDENQPEPYRSPLPYDTPIVVTIPTRQNPIAEIQVAMQNEDPETEDDLTLMVKFTGEGMIVDLIVSDAADVGTFAMTYEDMADRCH